MLLCSYQNLEKYFDQYINSKTLLNNPEMSILLKTIKLELESRVLLDNVLLS